MTDSKLPFLLGSTGLGQESPSVTTVSIVDKGTVWTAARVNRFHQYYRGIYNL